MQLTATHLDALLGDYLAGQRWFAGDIPHESGCAVVAFEEIAESVYWALVEVDGAGRYQVFLATQRATDPPDFLRGKEAMTLGEVELDGEAVVVHDAFVDPRAAIAVLGHIAPGETATSVRPLTVEQSNTSIVFDERLIVKVFRRIHEGANPDVEVTERLGRVGFDAASEPLAVWRHHGYDLAVVRRYLVGSTDGLAFAEVSLRDLYDRQLPPGEAGGDFGPEARRLGEITARLHLALADAFGVDAASPGEWAEQMLADLDVFAGDDVIDRDGARQIYADLVHVSDPGVAMRIHGDYHLGQTLRTDHGWFVLDFEGEPSRPLEDRVLPSSPLRDVAGMLRSFQYASRIALAERAEASPQLVELAAQWEDRTAAMFVAGYQGVDGIEDLVPADERSWSRVLRAFELQKAIYELDYERHHRPHWSDIPTSAIRRILAVNRD